MELHEWLDAEKGRAVWIAEKIGRSKAAVSLWRDEGVPLPLIPRIADITAGQVSEVEMLRHAMRCKSSSNA